MSRAEKTAILIVMGTVFVWCFSVGFDRTVEADKGIPQRNLHKIFFTGNFIRNFHSHSTEWQPSDRELRYLLVELTDYNSCKQLDYFDDTEVCMSKIGAEEIRMVRMAYEQPDRFQILLLQEEQ